MCLMGIIWIFFTSYGRTHNNDIVQVRELQMSFTDIVNYKVQEQMHFC